MVKFTEFLWVPRFESWLRRWSEWRSGYRVRLLFPSLLLFLHFCIVIFFVSLRFFFSYFLEEDQRMYVISL
jgi:hypothetical protein